MSEFEREEKSTLLKRLGEVPKNLIVLTGPRQCGKTTVLLQALKSGTAGYLYVDLDRVGVSHNDTIFSSDPNFTISIPQEIATPRVNRLDAEWLVWVWQAARIQVKQSDSGYILALDEIQKIPNWSQIVKGLWDADRIEGRQMHVVLSGSAPLLVQKGLTESLAGRFETIRLNHWSFAEMAETFDFNLDKFIYFGGYPGSASLIDDEDRWRDYILDALVQTSIERDILAIQRIDKPILMKRLFELASNYSGQELAFNKMLGQLHDVGNTTTLARYLDLLSQVKLISGLSKYSQQRMRRGSTPKLIVHNTALMSAGSGYTYTEARADRTFWGRLVESAVGAHLLNSLSPRAELLYWRHNNVEVDFVITRANHVSVIEVKSGVKRISTKGFEKFEENYSSNARSIKRIEVHGSGTELADFLATPASQWLENL